MTRTPCRRLSAMSEVRAEIAAAEARLAELRRRYESEPVEELPDELRSWRVVKHVDSEHVVTFTAQRAGPYSACVAEDSAHDFQTLLGKLQEHERRWQQHPESLPAGLRERRWRSIP